MIDIKLIRQDPQRYIDGSKAKNIYADIDTLLAVDKELLANKQRLQDIATEKNAVGKSIPKLQAQEKDSALALVQEQIQT